MKTTKKNTYYVVQGQVDGGTFYDVDALKSRAAAEKTMRRILKHCFPKWRGLDLGFRIIRRTETITTESEVLVFTSQPSGKVRSRLAELFVPEWLPGKLKAKLKDRPIP
jgi:hypothetical protein